MNIVNITETYLEDCLTIAKKQYRKECESVEALYEESYEKELFQRLEIPCAEGSGIVCLNENHVCGYLIVDRTLLDVKVDYINIPVWGYGIAGNQRRKVMSFMFQFLAKKVMNSNSKVQFNVKIYAHDREIISYFTLCQFGIICTDAIRTTLTTICPKKEVYCKEISNPEILDRKEQILKLYGLLVKHLQQSPVFYPGKEFTDEIYMQYILCDTTRMFAAFDGEEIIGIMDASIDKECFLLNSDKIYNVGDIYVEEAYRGKSAAQSILQYANNILKEEGAEKLWVEHGTANPNAAGFWDKYFENFTYTFVRDVINIVNK